MPRLAIKLKNKLSPKAPVRNIAIVIAIPVLFGANLAYAQDVDRTPSPAAAHDLDGNLLDQVTVGHQVILSKTFENSRSVPQPFVAVFEVRDSDGVTVHLAWQSGIMAAGGHADVAISWVAGSAGTYDIRTFPLSGLKNPVPIGEVESRSIPVLS